MKDWPRLEYPENLEDDQFEHHTRQRECDGEEELHHPIVHLETNIFIAITVSFHEQGF